MKIPDRLTVSKIFLCLLFSVGAIGSEQVKPSGGLEMHRTVPPEVSKYIRDLSLGKQAANSVDPRGRPALISAILYGDADLIKILLNQGASLDSMFRNVPAIFFATSDDCMAEKLQLLLEAGADPNTKVEIIGHTFPIHASVSHQDLSCFELLVKYGARVDALDSEGRSPYWDAIFYINQNAVRRLYELGLDLFAKDIYGMDAVHHAVIAKQSELVRNILWQESKKKYQLHSVNETTMKTAIPDN